MEDLKGRRVVSTKGRDLGKAYVIIQVVDAYFLRLSDGDKYPVAAPKRKNKKHVALAEDFIPTEWLQGKQANDRIKEYLNVSTKED